MALPLLIITKTTNQSINQSINQSMLNSSDHEVTW